MGGGGWGWGIVPEPGQFQNALGVFLRLWQALYTCPESPRIAGRNFPPPPPPPPHPPPPPPAPSPDSFPPCGQGELSPPSAPLSPLWTGGNAPRTPPLRVPRPPCRQGEECAPAPPLPGPSSRLWTGGIAPGLPKSPVLPVDRGKCAPSLVPRPACGQGKQAPCPPLRVPRPLWTGGNTPRPPLLGPPSSHMWTGGQRRTRKKCISKVPALWVTAPLPLWNGKGAREKCPSKST